MSTNRTAFGVMLSNCRLQQAVRVLDIVHESLVKDVSVTKRYSAKFFSSMDAHTDITHRDIFYRDVPLFKAQSTVDKACQCYLLPFSCVALILYLLKLVDDFAATFGTSRGNLNVVRLPSLLSLYFHGLTSHCREPPQKASSVAQASPSSPPTDDESP